MDVDLYLDNNPGPIAILPLALFRYQPWPYCDPTPGPFAILPLALSLTSIVVNRPEKLTAIEVFEG